MRIRGGMSSRLGQKSFRFYFREKYGSDLLRYALFDKNDEYKSFSLRNDDWFSDHNHVLWRIRDKPYNGGRWQYIIHDTEYSAGHYNQEISSPETDHFRRAIKNFPVFGAVIRNKDFYAMFLKAIKKAGSENYNYERARAKMDYYDKIWAPLMPDFYKRFGGSFQERELYMKLSLDFFRKRYGFIIPMVESWKP